MGQFQTHALAPNPDRLEWLTHYSFRACGRGPFAKGRRIHEKYVLTLG